MDKPRYLIVFAFAALAAAACWFISAGHVSASAQALVSAGAFAAVALLTPALYLRRRAA